MYIRVLSRFDLTIVNQCLHFSTVLGVVINCKQYSGITVESGTHVSVKIPLNIFAVQSHQNNIYISDIF